MNGARGPGGCTQRARPGPWWSARRVGDPALHRPGPSGRDACRSRRNPEAGDACRTRPKPGGRGRAPRPPGTGGGGRLPCPPGTGGLGRLPRQPGPARPGRRVAPCRPGAVDGVTDGCYRRPVLGLVRHRPGPPDRQRGGAPGAERGPLTRWVVPRGTVFGWCGAGAVAARARHRVRTGHRSRRRVRTGHRSRHRVRTGHRSRRRAPGGRGSAPGAAPWPDGAPFPAPLPAGRPYASTGTAPFSASRSRISPMRA